VLNEIGIDHPFVCVNLDWWPDSKCDYGNCSWTGAELSAELRKSVVEQQKKTEELQAAPRKNTQARCFQMKRPTDLLSGCQNMTCFKLIRFTVFLC